MTGREAAAFLNISYTAFNYTVHLLGIKSNGGFTQEQIEEVKRFRELPKGDPYKLEVYGNHRERQINYIPITTLTGQYLKEKYGSIYARHEHEKEYNRLYAREYRFNPKDLDEFKQTCTDEAIKSNRGYKKEAVIRAKKRVSKQNAEIKNLICPFSEYIQFDPTFVFGEELKEEYYGIKEAWGGLHTWSEKNDAKFEATAYILCKYHYWSRDDYHRFKNHRLWLRANQMVKLEKD